MLVTLIFSIAEISMMASIQMQILLFSRLNNT
jgi:hypothetical protein